MLIKHMNSVCWWWKLSGWNGACWRLHLQSRGAKNILNFIYKLWALAYKCVVMETIMSPPNFRLEERPLVIVVNSDAPNHVLCLCFFSEMSIKNILNSCCLVNFCFLDRLVLSINVLKMSICFSERGVLKCVRLR